MKDKERFERAITAFDQYNSRDPNKEIFEGLPVAKELLYARRMTERLMKFIPDPPEHLQLAARSQHIGRWEIPRSSYPMDKKGYFQWRNKLKDHHAAIAAAILEECGYEQSMIENVKSLLLKKELATRPDTQAIEDVICLVFLEFYIDEFASKYDDTKVIDILQKTMRKMSAKAIESVATISLSEKIKLLIYEASAS